MLELINHSNFAAGLYTCVDQNNNPQLTCVIKGTWQFNGAGKLKLQKPWKIEETDQYYESPQNSSLKVAHEIMPYKQGSEFLLYGTAQPINDKSIIGTVSVKIEWPDRIWEKRLTIFGPRCWQSMLMGYIPGEPKILKPLPIKYEYAYGGRDERGRKNFYSKNPVGLGFTESSGYKDLPMPQIENVLIKKVSDRPEPAGFGPILTTWQLSEKKSKEKQSISNVAPRDQRFHDHFVGGEKIYLKNLVKNKIGENVCLLVVPGIKPKLRLYIDEEMKQLEPKCDMLIIDSDKMVLNILWRMDISWDTETEEGVLLLL